MKNFKFILFMFLIFFAFGDYLSSKASSRINYNRDAVAIPGEILIKFRSGIFDREPSKLEETQYPSINEIFSRLQARSMKRVFQNADLDIFHLKFDARLPILDALTLIAGDFSVEWVEPNYVSSTFFTPNDPYFPLQWGLTKIQADRAWDISTGNPNIVIAIIDTGVDYDHIDLANNIWYNPGEIPNNSLDDDGNGYIDDYMGWDFISVNSNAIPTPDPYEDIGPPDNNPMDFHGHGTHCSGIASSVTNNSTGVAGIAGTCKIMCLRAGYKTSTGGGSLPYSDSARAIEYAADNGAKVISMSWGSTTASGTIQTVVEYARTKGCIMVAAAGNDGKNMPNYPAAFPGVISVAASDQDDLRASFSNYGDWVDIAAPGKDIYSTKYNSSQNNNTYGYSSGTSMATPLVAGAAALLLAQNPNLTADLVLQRLLDTADPINWNVSAPTKRLNIYRALWLGSLSIAINSPSNNAKIKGDSPYNIIWQTTGEDIDHIHLLYSTDGGTTYQDIIDNTENDGKYQWNPVPAIDSTTVRIKAIIKDAANNAWKEYSTGNFTIDSTPPVTTSSSSGTQGENGWYRSDVTVALSATDNLTGVKERKYNINNGVWRTYTSPFTVSLNSSIKYFSVDSVGNTESVKSMDDIMIDKIPPETSVDFTGNLGNNGWYKSDIIAILSATDSNSGVKETEYKIGDDSWQIYESPFTIDTTSIFYYKSSDIAGNEEIEKSHQINIDKSPPVTIAQLAGTLGDDGWHTTNVTVALNATDDISGVNNRQYKINEGSWQNYSSPFIIVTGSKVYYRSEDRAGNLETEKSIEIKIDKTPPSVPTVTDDGRITNSKTDLNASWTNSKDDQSDISEYFYTITTSPNENESQVWKSAGLATVVNASGLTLVEGQIYYIGVKAKNGAGLLSLAGFSDGIIINAPPIVSVIPNIEFPEDTSDSSIDLDDYVYDLTDDISEIVWTYAGNKNINVNIDSNTHIVTFTPLPDWNGNEDITFTATDPGGYSDSQTITVTITPVNDPPIVKELMINPNHPGPNDDLSASYVYSDIDDGEDNSQIKWYKNGNHQPSLDDKLIVSSSLTHPKDKWYFVVIPNDGMDTGEVQTSSEVIITGMDQEIHFYPGWNLFSIYINTGNMDVSSVLMKIDGLYSIIWTYDAGWKKYIPESNDNNLNTIESGRGYWIYIIGEDEVIFRIAGEEVFNTSISLNSGLNLVGYNSIEPKLFDTALADIKYAYIYTYDNELKKWISYFTKGPGFLNNIINFTPGNGYWIYAEENTIWNVSP